GWSIRLRLVVFERQTELKPALVRRDVQRGQPPFERVLQRSRARKRALIQHGEREPAAFVASRIVLPGAPGGIVERRDQRVHPLFGAIRAHLQEMDPPLDAKVHLATRAAKDYQ